MNFPLTDPQKLTFQPCVDLWLSCDKRNKKDSDKQWAI